jgi:hypothetical protein
MLEDLGRVATAMAEREEEMAQILGQSLRHPTNLTSLVTGSVEAIVGGAVLVPTCTASKESTETSILMDSETGCQLSRCHCEAVRHFQVATLPYQSVAYNLIKINLS